MENGVVKITTNRNLETVNGVVYILTGDTPTNVTTPMAVPDGEGEGITGQAVSINPGEASAKFYKIGVGYEVPASPEPDPEP